MMKPQQGQRLKRFIVVSPDGTPYWETIEKNAGDSVIEFLLQTRKGALAARRENMQRWIEEYKDNGWQCRKIIVEF